MYNWKIIGISFFVCLNLNRNNFFFFWKKLTKTEKKSTEKRRRREKKVNLCKTRNAFDLYIRISLKMKENERKNNHLFCYLYHLRIHRCNETMNALIFTTTKCHTPQLWHFFKLENLNQENTRKILIVIEEKKIKLN